MIGLGNERHGPTRLLKGDLIERANRQRPLTELSDRRRAQRVARTTLDAVGWGATTATVASHLVHRGFEHKDVRQLAEAR